MQLFSVDSLIVVASLLITLIIGLRAGSNIKDIREYAIANKMFGTGVLLFTFLATNIGGASTLGTASDVFADGVSIIFALSGVGLSMLIIRALVIPYMGHFSNAITIGDVMGSLYGQYSQIITGTLGVFYSTCMIGMELVLLGQLCEYFWGIKAIWGAGLGGVLLAAYTAHGGMKSVALTDVFQFLILCIMLPFIATSALKEVGGLSAMFATVPSNKFAVFTHSNFSFYLTLFLVWSIFPVGLTSPAIFQRLLMAKEVRHLKRQYLISAGFDPLLQITVMLIGLAGLVLYPHTEARYILPHITQELLPVGAKGLAISGLFAIIISTADSYLHSAGLLLTHDVIAPLSSNLGKKANELVFVRYSTIIIGLAAIMISAKATHIMGLSFAALRFTGPALLFPLMAGIMGLKPDKSAFYNALLATLFAFVLSTLLLPVQHSHLAVVISLLVNGLVFFSAHALRYKGFVILQNDNRTIGKMRKLSQHEHLFIHLKKIFITPSAILDYSRDSVTRYGASYILFGSFCCINFTFPYFLWIPDSVGNHDLITYVRLIGAALSGLLVVKDKWPPSLLPYLPTFWHLTLLFCIPFTGTVMFLLTQGSIEWLINVAITIMFLIVLVDWLTFFILTGLGITLGILFYRVAIGPISLQLDFTTGYLLVYQGVFATVIGLLFARRKELRTDREHNMLKAQDEASKTSLLQVAAEKHQALQAIQGTGVQNLMTIAKDLQKLPVKEEATEQLHALGAMLIPIAFQLQSINTKARDYLRLQIASVSIEQLLGTVQERLRATGLAHRLHYKPTTQYETLVCDAERITTLLTQSIMNLQASSKAQHQEEPPLYLIGLEDTLLFYPASDVEAGYVKKVKALRMVVTIADHLPALAPSYWADLTTSEATTGSETSQKLEELAHQRIIKAHYGYAEVDANTLLYVIPIDVKEVRPKEMDKSYMELEVTPIRANDRFKSNTVDAQQQEKEFLAAVAQRSNADLGVVKTALELIKWYHGPVERLSGEPFYLHPLAVAQIVLDYDIDESTLLGALLHDTVEDTSMLLQHLETVFGKETAEIVDLVTHLQNVPDSFYKLKLSAEENIKMLERAENTHGLYVKLADRMHNIRTIEGHDSLAKQKSIAQETLQFFVPLAERLALQGVAEELQERCRAVMAKNK
ncbi:MAG: HD domain-containing protein [Bacteroidota bacterium]